MRKELLEICEKAFVKEKDWRDRDSASAQRQLGECYALLKAGCDFTILTEKSDENTIWLEVYSHGFCWFVSIDHDKSDMDRETYYLPTKKRLEETNGKDWY